MEAIQLGAIPCGCNPMVTPRNNYPTLQLCPYFQKFCNIWLLLEVNFFELISYLKLTAFLCTISVSGICCSKYQINKILKELLSLNGYRDFLEMIIELQICT